MDLIRRVKDWWQARKRGEVRIAPYPARGRVYTKTDGNEGGSPTLPAKGEPRAFISARVYRAATGKWEDHGVIAGPERTQVHREE